MSRIGLISPVTLLPMRRVILGDLQRDMSPAHHGFADMELCQDFVPEYIPAGWNDLSAEQKQGLDQDVDSIDVLPNGGFG